MSTYVCSKCGQEKSESDFYKKTSVSGKIRPVSADCRSCRAAYNLKRKGGAITGTCKICKSPGLLSSINTCKRCLKQQALKECADCGEVLVQELFFYRGRATCKDCSSGAASVAWAQAKARRESNLRGPTATSERDAQPDQPDNSGPSSHS
jgi:hypothetical protein